MKLLTQLLIIFSTLFVLSNADCSRYQDCASCAAGKNKTHDENTRDEHTRRTQQQQQQEDGTDNVDGVRDRMMEEPRIATIRVRFTISAPNPNS